MYLNQYTGILKVLIKELRAVALDVKVLLDKKTRKYLIKRIS
jgi:hypothetical protein